jgi:hypothetical protein
MDKALLEKALHLVKFKKSYYIFYSSFVWAVFSLGIGQLILVLLGPVLFLLVSFSFSILFSFFLFRSKKYGSLSRAQITNLYLLSIGLTFSLSLFYGYMVFLKFTWSSVQLFGVSSLICLLPLLLYQRPQPKKSRVI